MLPISKDEILDLLTNPKKGASNHYIATCPACEKPNHFFINIITGNWDCKKCEEAGNIFRLLFLLGKDVEIVKKTVNIFAELIPPDDDPDADEEDLEIDAPVQLLPLGFKRLTTHPYLQTRHLLPADYTRFRIGTTNLKRLYKDYILFSVDEDSKSRGFVGRTIHSKTYIKEHDIQRYRNSTGVKFGNLLFGYDLITANTNTVIIVEGLFDVIRINNLLDVYTDDQIRTVASFGKKISTSQILKLLAKGNVQNIILIYDTDAVNQTKKYANKLEQFFNVKVGFFTNGKDASDSTDQEVFTVFNNLQTAVQFFYNKIPVPKFSL